MQGAQGAGNVEATSLESGHNADLSDARYFFADEKTISTPTTACWLRKLGFKYKKYFKDIYNDGHEREDVKNYHDNIFLPEMESFKYAFLVCDENLQEIPNPGQLSGDTQPVVLVTQDECTFNSNNSKHNIWVHPQYKHLPKKGHGQGLHVSEFLTSIGRLSNGAGCMLLKCDGQVWWNSDRQLEDLVEKAIPAFEAQFPGCKALFAFHNAPNHLKFADDALRVCKMNLEPG